jgi:hypothetical protein
MGVDGRFVNWAAIFCHGLGRATLHQIDAVRSDIGL